MSRVTSEPPLSEDLEREFAGKWVLIRDGQVIKSADTIEELLDGRELGERDIVDHIPPDQPTFY